MLSTILDGAFVRILFLCNLYYIFFSVSVCNDVMIVRKKYVSSPNYPDNYPENLNCTWIIKSPRYNHEIVMKIRDMEIEAQAVCQFDYIQIGSGEIPGRNIIVNRLCGSRKPGPIKSDNGALWLRFVSDNEKSFRGFRATWKAKKISRTFPYPVVDDKNG